eukprot:gene31458-6641_t
MDQAEDEAKVARNGGHPHVVSERKVRPNHMMAGLSAEHNGSQGILLPGHLRVLVVDSRAASRAAVVAVKTSKEALQLLAPMAAKCPFDLILKEHEPPVANACRLLRRMARSELLTRIPVVLMSSQDEREVVMKCLTLGAIDYLVKPLRQNELRHIWTRVWWWRRSGLGSNAMTLDPQCQPSPAGSSSHQASSIDSKDTDCDEEEEPTSKEGSAPDDGIGMNGSNGNDNVMNASNANGSNGNGSNGSKEGNGTSSLEAAGFGQQLALVSSRLVAWPVSHPASNTNGSNGNGSNGSKEGNGTSRVEAKPHAVGDGNGNSDNKNLNGNSATKNVNYRSNGNAASTTLAEQNALVNTAEGKAPASADVVCYPTPKGRNHSQLPSRKRPASSALEAAGGMGRGSSADPLPQAPEPLAGQQLQQQNPELAQAQFEKPLHVRRSATPRKGSADATSVKNNNTSSNTNLLPDTSGNGQLHRSSGGSAGGVLPCSGPGSFPFRVAVGGRDAHSSPASFRVAQWGGDNTTAHGVLGNSRSASADHYSQTKRQQVQQNVGKSTVVSVDLGSGGTGTGSNQLPSSHLEAQFRNTPPPLLASGSVPHSSWLPVCSGGQAGGAGPPHQMHGFQPQGQPPHGFPHGLYSATSYGNLAAIQHLAAIQQHGGPPAVYSVSGSNGGAGSHNSSSRGGPVEGLPPAFYGATEGLHRSASGQLLHLHQGGSMHHQATPPGPAMLHPGGSMHHQATAPGPAMLHQGGSIHHQATPPGLTLLQRHLMGVAGAVTQGILPPLDATSAKGLNPLIMNPYLQAYINQAAPHQAAVVAAATAAQQHLQNAAAGWLVNPAVNMPPGFPMRLGPPHGQSRHPVAPPPHSSSPMGAGQGLDGGHFTGMGQMSSNSAPHSGSTQGALPGGGPEHRHSETAVDGLSDFKMGCLSGLQESHGRRALALAKYRQKRKNLKFSRTIRYESRKQLANARPRVKGQFVKHGHSNKIGEEGVNQGQSFDDDDDDECDEMDGEDEEDLEDTRPRSQLPPAKDDSMAAGAGGSRPSNKVIRLVPIGEKKAGAVGLRENEDNVVNSQREQRDGPSRVFSPSKEARNVVSPSKDARDAGDEKGSGGDPCQASLRSQSGQSISRGGSYSRPSHGRLLQKQHSQVLATRGAPDRGDGDQGGGGGGGTHLQHSHGRNGSDSGSNSPHNDGGGGRKG